jgi:hypothetical protein
MKPDAPEAGSASVLEMCFPCLKPEAEPDFETSGFIKRSDDGKKSKKKNRQSKFEKYLHFSEAKQSNVHFLQPTQSVITQANATLFKTQLTVLDNYNFFYSASLNGFPHFKLRARNS